MSLYSLTNKDNVVQCNWNCKVSHEHYSGTYEGAVKYFGVDQNDINSWGKLINLVIYHQTSEYTFPKLSNELYDILINAQSEHKYWAPEENRKENAIKILDKAEEIGLILDEKLIEKFKNSDKKQNKDRLYMYNLWLKHL